MKFLKNINQFFPFKWISITVVTILVLFVYVFMEWIFLVTKPSFMSPIGFFEQLSIFFITTSLFITIYLFLVAIFALLSQIKINLLRNLIISLSFFIPGFIAAFLILLLIDNFTYTLFRIGIVTSSGLFRAFYGILFLVLIFGSVKQIYKYTNQIEVLFQKITKRSRIILLSIVLLVFVFVGTIPVITQYFNSTGLDVVTQSSKRPHIFLITADGVNAENMSLYGYERETTPFLNEMANSSLVAQNAFSNSANTTGSIISIFTSKSPIETHVLYPPDILKSEDVYQHLPGILKLNGYYTAQFSFDHYVDAYNLNLQNGFDEANGRSNQSNILNKINKFLPTNIGYFVYELSNRILDRIRHIFFIKKMTNPFLEVKSPKGYNDEDKFDSLMVLMETVKKPVFAHIHWMGTHGARFYPKNQVFSAGKDADRGVQAEYDLDFYDDSILEFDQAMSVFYHELESRGLLENSIIIVGSDHGQRFKTYKRLPLIFWFPNGEFQSKLYNNAQNMDIAPTILDYLDMDQPQWMKGNSLLKNIPQNRPIFSTGVGNVEVENGAVVPQTIKPPFYQFGFLGVVICDNWYRLNLDDFTWEEQKISEYVGMCETKEPTQVEVLEMMKDFLDQNGYDISSIESGTK